MFDPAQYLALQSTVTSLTRNGDIITVTQRQYSPVDGSELEPVITEIDAASLAETRAAFQSYIDNTLAFEAAAV